ncbi:MAG: signal peptide peptidase SppA, partial [Gammaproteobacteria bacterium]|nr:signal peptide peptidase SppA [Gammaproteobacteria bacterium]
MQDPNKPDTSESPSQENRQTGDSQSIAAEPTPSQEDVWTKSPAPDSDQSTQTRDTDKTAPDSGQEKWERDVVNRLAFASLNEQRRTRRWGIFFKSLVFVYLFAILFYLPTDWSGQGIKHGKHTALVDLQGVIAANTQASADNLITALRDAFEDKNTVAVILRINSPGGSPVQSGYVYDEIKRLRAKYPATKLYAVVTDICASGGYYIAAAADEIYADKASIVGSIGVLMDGFGFVDTLEKVGVQRRLMTAGEHKGILDPFSPLKPSEVKHVQNLLDSVHRQFIDQVKKGRGDRLSDSPELFTGLFWNGEEGVKLGLVDGLGSTSYVARDIIGEENLVNFTVQPKFFDRFANRIGVT